MPRDLVLSGSNLSSLPTRPLVRYPKIVYFSMQGVTVCIDFTGANLPFCCSLMMIAKFNGYSYGGRSLEITYDR